MCISDNEIYSEDSPLAINNYALGYQDFIGFPGRSEKSAPLALENESYMTGWFTAKMGSLPNSSTVNPLYSHVRSVATKAKAIREEWEEYAKARGWRERFPV